MVGEKEGVRMDCENLVRDQKIRMIRKTNVIFEAQGGGQKSKGGRR